MLVAAILARVALSEPFDCQVYDAWCAFLGCRFHADKPCLRVSYCMCYGHLLNSQNPMEKLPARPPEDRPRDRTEGAKAAREGCGYFEGGQVARDRDWHGAAHLKRAWLKALTAICPPGGGGLFGFKFSSRRHPRKFGQKRFLAVRRSWRGNGVACFWATSLEKIFGGTTTLAAAKGRLIRCTVAGSTPNCLAMTRTPGRQEPPGPTPTRCATCALPLRAAITQRTRIASEFDRSIFWIS